MKNVFDRLVSRLYMAEEGISELEARIIETFQTKNRAED